MFGSNNQLKHFQDHLNQTNVADTQKQCLDDSVVSTSDVPIAKQEWLKVSFEFGPPLIGAIDHNYAANIPDDEVEAQDEQQLHLFEIQKLCLLAKLS